jgi:hypothetical protein
MITNMKRNLRILKAVLRMFGEDLFYNVSFTAGSVYLQGRYHSDKVKKIVSCKFTGHIADTGYISFNRGNIQITLTE